MTSPSPSALRSLSRGPGSLVAAALLLGSPLAVAAPPTGGCYVSAGQLNFGVYDPLRNQPHLMETTVNLDCHRSVDQVTLVLNSGAATAPGGRQLSSGGRTLRYELYRDVSRTDLCINGCSIMRNKQQLKQPVDVYLYGSIPDRQSVAPGTYTDTLVVTVVML